MRWKKINGFYLGLEREPNTVYVVDGNSRINGVGDGMRTTISHEFVDVVPDHLDEDVFYVCVR
jgi:hypothetical protein